MPKGSDFDDRRAAIAGIGTVGAGVGRAPREEPPPWLRGRIMDRVEIELCRRKSFFDRRLLVAVAAALVWLNLSLSATNTTSAPLGPPDSRWLGEPLARQIEQLLPELPRRMPGDWPCSIGPAPAWCPVRTCPPGRSRQEEIIRPGSIGRVGQGRRGGRRPTGAGRAGGSSELVGRRSLTRACPTLLVANESRQGERESWDT